MATRFAKTSVVTLIGIAALTAGFLSARARQPNPAPQTRSFRVGFCPFPSDDTPQAAKEVNDFIKANADIVAEHMESIPWAEALSGQPFKSGLMNSWRDRKNNVPPKGTVYLAVSPGRGALGDYWGVTEHDPMPEQFKGKAFNDPIVKQAYLNYCKRAVDFFQPEYLAIGIEVNELIYNAPGKAAAYAELHQYVYKELKKAHPNLPIFASFTIHALLDQRRTQDARDRSLAFQKSLMPYNDLVGISFYPFLGNLSDHLDQAFSFLSSNFDVYKKPYAVAETGEAADQLTVTMDGKPWHIDGSPARQVTYYQKLFAFAESHHTAFVISFLPKDYDALWKKIAANTTPVFQAWQDNGFVDQDGVVRPAYKVWKQVYDMPLHQ